MVFLLLKEEGDTLVFVEHQWSLAEASTNALDESELLVLIVTGPEEYHLSPAVIGRGRRTTLLKVTGKHLKKLTWGLHEE